MPRTSCSDIKNYHKFSNLNTTHNAFNDSIRNSVQEDPTLQLLGASYFKVHKANLGLKHVF